MKRLIERITEMYKKHKSKGIKAHNKGVKVDVVSTKESKPTTASKESIDILTEFMTMTVDQVYDRFKTLPHAVVRGECDQRFLFMPGKRKDRVLLVAHSDTVRLSAKPPSLTIDGNTMRGKNEIIGADDRAGCAILWMLRESGHSLFIPDAEENGGIGSAWAMSSPEWKNHLNKTHQFAIQFDRANSKDLVYYDVGTAKFAKYCEDSTGFKSTTGSFSDIAVICKEICGVNMSVGYYGQHGNTERIELDEWEHTLNVARKWIDTENLPKFLLSDGEKYKEQRTVYTHQLYNYGDGWQNSGTIWDEEDEKISKLYNVKATKKPLLQQNTRIISVTKKQTKNVECPLCKATVNMIEMAVGLFSCPQCQQDIASIDMPFVSASV